MKARTPGAALRGLLAAWALASVPAFAGDILSTEIDGTVLKGKGRALGPMRALDRLAAGERVIVRAKSRLVVFVADEGALYTVAGPAEIHVAPNGLKAVQGALPPPQQLGAAFTGLKVSVPDLAQGKLVARSTGGPRLESPEGFVAAEQARRFSWTAGPGIWRIELATDRGELLLSTEAFDGSLDLPADVTLRPGEKYVWGIGAPQAQGAPADWTEFVIRDGASIAQLPQRPAAGASVSEWLLYSAWLRSQAMPRAATRAAARSAAPQ